MPPAEVEPGLGCRAPPRCSPPAVTLARGGPGCQQSRRPDPLIEAQVVPQQFGNGEIVGGWRCCQGCVKVAWRGVAGLSVLAHE